MNIEKYLDSIIAKAGKDGAAGVIDKLINKCNKLQNTENKMHSTMYKFGDSEALEQYMNFNVKFSKGMKEAQEEASRLKQIIGSTKLNTVEFETMKTDIVALCKRFDILAQSARVAKGIKLNDDGLSLKDDDFKIPNKIESVAKAYESKQRAAKAQEQSAREAAKAQEQSAREAAKAQEQAAKAAAEQRIKAANLKQNWFTNNSTFSSEEFKAFDTKINQLKKAKERLTKKGGSNDDILSLNNEIAKLQAINERVKQLRESLKLAGKDTNLTNNIKNEISAAKMHYDNIIKSISSKNLGIKLPSTFEKDLTNQLGGGKISSIKNLFSQIGGVISSVKSNIQSVVSVAVSAFKKIASAIKTCVSVLKTFASAIPKILSLMSNLGNRVKSIFSKIGNTLSNTFDNFLNNKYVASGLGVLQSIQTLNTIIGNELTTNTINWANSLENAFGLSASGIVSDLKQISGVLYGLGMKSEETYNASRNLITIGTSLSNILGYSQEVVIDKISSGLKGMTQSIDDLGLSVRESEMNSFLKKLKAQGGIYANIATSFSSLNEEARIYVRYAALIKKYTDNYDVNTYVKSLNSISGHINVLKNQFRTFINTLGTLFLQLFDRIIKPITLIVNSLTQGVKYVAGLLNIDLTLSSSSNGGSTAFENIKDGALEAADSVDEMTESLENAKGALDDLDHITNLNKSSGSASGASGSSFDYSLLMDIGAENNKQLADTLTGINKANKNYFDEMKKQFPGLTSTLTKLSIVVDTLITGNVTSDDIVDLGGIESTWGKINEIASTIHSIFETIGEIFGDLLDELVKWLKDEGIDIIKGFVDKVDKFLKDNKDVIEKILKNLLDLALISIETFLNLVLALLKYIVDHESTVNNIIELLKGLLKAISNNSDGVVEFVVQFGLLTAAFSGIIGLLTGSGGVLALLGGSGGLIALLGGLAVALEVLVFSKIFDAVDKAVEPRRESFEKREEENYKQWKEYYASTHNGQAAPVDSNGKLILPESVQNKMISNLENDVNNVMPEWWQRGARMLMNADESSALKMNTSSMSDKEFEAKYGSLAGATDAVNFSIGKLMAEKSSGNYKEQINAIKENTKAQTEVVKSLDEVMEMGNVTEIKSTKSIKGYANGGIPKSGSLFLANENGNTELVGNFGGYSGVATQQMVMTSIQNGVYQAVKKALAESGDNHSTNNITVAPDGLFIGDEASIRKLATLINNANRKTNQNVANISYSM